METIGVLFFLLIAGMAFWVLIFLATFLPYMIGGFKLDLFAPKLADKIFGKANPNAVRSYPVAGELGAGGVNVEVESETTVVVDPVDHEPIAVIEETEVTVTPEETEKKTDDSTEESDDKKED